MDTKTTIRLALLGAVMLTGCQLKIDPSILPVLPNATLPPSVMPASPPVASPGVRVSPTPRPKVSFDPASCTRADPAAAPSVGNSRQGTYNGQRLPNGWDVGLEDEGAVTDAITRVSETADWACFTKFYPGAATVWDKVRNHPRPAKTPYPPGYCPPNADCFMPPSIPPYFYSPPPPPPPCWTYPSAQVAISGTVYDEQGVPFPDGVEVRVRNKDHSFSVDAMVEGGRFYVYGAPQGVRLEITAVHVASGEARRRFITPQGFFDNACADQSQGFAVVNFGGPKTPEDAMGARYPLPTTKATIKKDEAEVRGYVADIFGKPVEDARITISSVVKDVAYTSSVVATGGKYSLQGVPAGTPMEVRVERPGYSARARLAVFFLAGSTRQNVVSFGGKPTIEDPVAPKYALLPVPTDDMIKRVALKGKIVNGDGKLVTKGVVRVESANDKIPFKAETAITEGGYMLPDVPAGIEVVITVEAPGFYPISRYERIFVEFGNVISFGTPISGDDPGSAAYPLIEEGQE